MAEWNMIAAEYMGWTLSDIKDMSPRERQNWIEVTRVHV